MKIELIKRNSPAYENLVQEIDQLRWWNYPKDSGRRVAANALKDQSVEFLLIREPLINIPIGILSFREEDNRFVKIVNLGVAKRGRGVGSALIEKVRKIAGPDRSVWLRSMNEDTDSFYERIGGQLEKFQGGMILNVMNDKKTFQFSGI